MKLPGVVFKNKKVSKMTKMSCFFTPDICDCKFYVTDKMWKQDKKLRPGIWNWKMARKYNKRILLGILEQEWVFTSSGVLTLTFDLPVKGQRRFREKRIPFAKCQKKTFRNPGYIITEETKLILDQRCDSRLMLAGHGFYQLKRSTWCK